jgi:hypothetical protein
MLGDVATGTPVGAGGGSGHERLVDQVPAQGAVVVDDRFEDLVDDGFRVVAARLECLGHLVKQQPATGALGRHRGDLAVTDEGPQLIRRVGEESISVMNHHGSLTSSPA